MIGEPLPGHVIAKVAERAGVSRRIVAMVLTGRSSVAPMTRNRVIAAIAEVGSPHQVPADGGPDIVGVMVQHAARYDPAPTVRAICDAALSAGLSPVLGPVAGPDAAPAVRQTAGWLLGRGAIGLIWVAPDGPLPAMPAPAAMVTVDAPPHALVTTDTAPHAMVTVDTTPHAAVTTDTTPHALLTADTASHALVTAAAAPHTVAVPDVSTDHQAGARLATALLLQRGHRPVWHVGGPPECPVSQQREAGWRAALTAAGVEPPPVIRADWSAAAGYRAGRLLAAVAQCRAVFAAGDQIALGVLRAMAEAGRSVPADVSVVGFDDLPASGFLSPALTTVRPDLAEVGREAVRLLLAQRRTGSRPLGSVSVSPVLVERQTVTPSPGGRPAGRVEPGRLRAWSTTRPATDRTGHASPGQPEDLRRVGRTR